MLQDPYKYFRIEARELLDGLTEGVLELEKGTEDHERIGSLLRLAHTLKGAARVVKQPAIADLAHSIEDILSPFREEAGTVPDAQTRDVLQMLDQIGVGLAALDSSSPRNVPESKSKTATIPAALETMRVEVEEVEALLRRLSEIGNHLASLEQGAEVVKQAKVTAGLLVQQLQVRSDEPPALIAGRMRSQAEKLHDSLQVLDRQLAESAERMAREHVQADELANRLRLLPAAAIFPVLERVVRDAAVTLGKQVQLRLDGDIRLDANVLTLLRDAFVQLLRNAVAHGIEEAPRRAAAGKPACGCIDFKVERRGNRVAFLCRDDGAGIDLGAIRRVAVQKGMVSKTEAESLRLPQAIDIIFRGGVSTSGQVDEISGRGIGLDVVRAAVAQLKGDISVETAQARGTQVEIRVPASLVSVQALTVNSGGVIASLPLDCVLQTVRIDNAEIARCGAQESVAYQGRAIPFLSLSTALDVEASCSPARQRWSAIIVASGDAQAAIGVDRLMGTGTVMVRALPALAPAERVVNGATLDSQGNPRLFLDPAGLVECAAQIHRRTSVRDLMAAPVLVIDDSLTTRMVEQSILESAGYDVHLATSGEEALEKALSQRYSLFLVDVEMPGMNGFEFISRTRRDPVLRDVPAILVTSRMSPEDHRRGEEVGALAYIVKSEFDQGSFLETIQRLAR